VNESRYNLRAEIRNLESERDIRLLVNGRVISNFRYDMANEILTANLSLIEGTNTIEITARNRRGEASATTTIIYEIPILPPTIRLAIPNNTPHRTTASSQNIRLDITQINTQRGDQISFVSNGFPSNRFEYDNRNGRLTANLNLEIGQNFLTVGVANKAGEARLDLVIIREQVVVLPPRPTITVTNRQVSPITGGNTCNVDVRVTINHVTDRQQVTVRIGNSNYTGFTFNPSNGQLRIQTSIPSGNTNIIISAANPGGAASETVVLGCTPTTIPVNPPQVNITQPQNNATVTIRNQEFVANVLNVNAKEEITITINGNELRSFNWNPGSNRVTVNANLLPGINQLLIRAQNSGGTATDMINVNYAIPTPPTVVIDAPDNNSKATQLAVNFEARVTNISQKSQVTLYLNGKGISNFSLNGNKVLAAIDLQPGNNAIKIEVKNADGSAQAETRVTYDMKGPEIIGRIPSTDTTMMDTRLNFSARILNIQSVSQVSLSLNGRKVTRPAFDANTGLLTNRMVLRPGRNVIIVEATNAVGKAKKEFNVIVDTRTPTPPEVKIISASQPAFDPFNPEEGRSIVIGEVKHVPERSGIVFLHNGKPFESFTYDIKTGRFEASVPLLRGSNRFELRATNMDGTASDTTEVQY